MDPHATIEKRLMEAQQRRNDYKPLHSPLVPLKPGESRARKAETYRANGCPPHTYLRGKHFSIEVRYEPYTQKGKWTPYALRMIRAKNGVGRPPV